MELINVGGHWFYNEKINVPDYFGFVYKITNKLNGKFYIGKKQIILNKKKKLTKKQIAELTGPGRKPSHEVIKVESDWYNYLGSSKELLNDIKQLGKDNFECIILRPCKTKKELTYYEIHYQCLSNCLLPGISSYNENILGRFFPKDFL